jgi:large subunit ribosomal protein L9
MKVVLQKDVKDLGKVGEVLNVKEGFARNFLFPKKVAVAATEKKVKEFEHLKRVAEVKKAKAVDERKVLITKLNGLVIDFKVQASETEKLFGSISNIDLSKELSKKGFEIDKADIQIEEPIKVLGQHKASIVFGDEASLKAEITVSVERL